MISSYFEEKGLVRQQLDSFDEFTAHCPVFSSGARRKMATNTVYVFAMKDGKYF